MSRIGAMFVAGMLPLVLSARTSAAVILPLTVPAVAQPTAAAPSLVVEGPRACMSLNGVWQVRPVDDLQFTFPPPEEGWKEERVPAQASPPIQSAAGNPYGEALAAYLTPEGRLKQTEGTGAWFRRSFELPAGCLVGKRALLRFGGMAFRSVTYLNGQKFGESVLGQVPVEYDVPGTLKQGATNELCVGLTAREGIIDLADKTFVAHSALVVDGAGTPHTTPAGEAVTLAAGGGAACGPLPELLR